jgi:uncharacterized protein YoxC
MEMSTVLQVALFLAALAFIVLVACLIPLAFQARRRLEHLAVSAEQLKANVELLVQDSRELVRNVNELEQQVSRQMDDVGQVVGTVRRWTERADRLVEEVGSVIEPPVFAWVRNVNLFRLGATTFLQAFFHTNRNQNKTKQEKHHG